MIIRLLGPPGTWRSTVSCANAGDPHATQQTPSRQPRWLHVMILHQLLLAVRQDEALRVRCDDSRVDQAFEDQSGGVGRTACKISVVPFLECGPALVRFPFSSERKITPYLEVGRNEHPAHHALVFDDACRGGSGVKLAHTWATIPQSAQ